MVSHMVSNKKTAANAAASLCFCIWFGAFGFLYDGTGHFFEFYAGHHDEVTAALAFDSEVHANACNAPFIAAAGVFFLHTDDVPHIIMYTFHKIAPRLFFPKSISYLYAFVGIDSLW